MEPWPVENQVTDRAHRIGQDKPVFVFKLIAAGTIEERMLELQERKQALADHMLDGSSGLGGLQETDLEMLFAPLSGMVAAHERGHRG